MSERKEKPVAREWGQSLAETALVLPILILLIVGVVEVSQMAITAHRLTTASRTAVRFAANGGEEAGIRDLALSTVTDTLDLSPERWDIWHINAKVADDGTIPPENFSYNHIYGNQRTRAFTRTNRISTWQEARVELQDQLRKDEYGGAADPAGLEVDAVLLLYDMESILGLNAIPTLVGLNTVRSMSFMRHAATSVVEQTAGCTGVFPLALEENVRTITRAEYEGLVDGGAFEYPATPPRWEGFVNQPQAGATASLTEGREGYIYKFDVGTGSQNVGLLQWDPAGGSLSGSLAWPGNSENYSEPGDPTDTTLNVQDFVARSGEGLSASVKAELQDHVDKERTLRVITWDASAGGYDGGGDRFRTNGFAVVRVRGYGAGWVLLEIYRLDNSCGRQS